MEFKLEGEVWNLDFGGSCEHCGELGLYDMSVDSDEGMGIEWCIDCFESKGKKVPEDVRNTVLKQSLHYRIHDAEATIIDAKQQLESLR